MTAREANKLAAAMLLGLPVVEASADDARVRSGELVACDEMRKEIAGDLLEVWNDLERKLCSREAAEECAGKSRTEIATIMTRRLASTDLFWITKSEGET